MVLIEILMIIGFAAVALAIFFGAIGDAEKRYTVSREIQRLERKAEESERKYSVNCEDERRDDAPKSGDGERAHYRRSA